MSKILKNGPSRKMSRFVFFSGCALWVGVLTFMLSIPGYLQELALAFLSIVLFAVFACWLCKAIIGSYDRESKKSRSIH